MVDFVKSVTHVSDVIKKGKHKKVSFGYILNAYNQKSPNLFGATSDYIIVFKDLVRNVIVRNAVMFPLNKATVTSAKLTDKYKHLFRKELEMIGGNVLKMLAQIRSEYDLNYQQAEFVLLAFYIINGDQDAYSTHNVWREHTIKNAPVIELDEVDVENLSDEQLNYLTNEEIQGLVDTGFFLEITKHQFRINKEKYYSTIFVTKQIAYYQLTRVFLDMSIPVNGNTHKVCNITDRTKATNEYWESIGGSVSKHQEVIEACEYAIDNDLVVTGLNKIIANELYFSWLSEMEGTTTDDEDDNECSVRVNIYD